jgi:hypothetical protein
MEDAMPLRPANPLFDALMGLFGGGSIRPPAPTIAPPVKVDPLQLVQEILAMNPMGDATAFPTRKRKGAGGTAEPTPRILQGRTPVY